MPKEQNGSRNGRPHSPELGGESLDEGLWMRGTGKGDKNHQQGRSEQDR